jgi:hypothetical protein
LIFCLLTSLPLPLSDSELTPKIFEILYATAEGFQSVEDTGAGREEPVEPSHEAEAEEEDETY